MFEMKVHIVPSGEVVVRAVSADGERPPYITLQVQDEDGGITAVKLNADELAAVLAALTVVRGLLK